MSALRILAAPACEAPVHNNAAAAPATVGEENDVPLTKESSTLGLCTKFQSPGPAMIHSDAAIAVPPRELKNATDTPQVRRTRGFNHAKK
jgi:hypothetical protein